MADIAQAMRYQIDIKHGLVKQPMTGELMRGDKNANRIIVQLVDGDQSVQLDGVTVTGKFFRGGDGVNIPLEGEANGNEATVLLDEHCYAVDGYFEASVKLTAGSQTRTILTITGSVVSDGEGGILDIENVVPSVADIVAQYKRMQEVTAQTEAARDSAIDARDSAIEASKQATKFAVLGLYETYEQLLSAHPTGEPGHAYAVGTEEDNVVYIWSTDVLAWVSIGRIHGQPGVGIAQIERTAGDGSAGSVDTYTITYTDGSEQVYQVTNGRNGTDGRDGTDGADGEDGGYYAPSVDGEGNLTWTASKEDMPDVSGANIRGPKGDSYVLTDTDKEEIAELMGTAVGTNPYATPEMYGAAGDGETDDTQALQSAIDSGRDVLLTGRYKVGEVKLAPYVTMTGAPGGRIVDGKVMMCPYSSIVGVVFEATAANANGCIVDIGTYDAAGVADSGGDDRYTIRDVKVLTDYAVKSDLDFLYVHVGDGELAHLFGINVSNVSINGRLGKVFHFRAHLSAGNIVDDGTGVWVNTVSISDVWCGLPEYIVYTDYDDPDDLKAQLGTALRIGEMYLSHVTGEYSAYAKNDVHIGFPTTISATDVGLVDKGYTQDGGDPATAMYSIEQQPWYNSARTIIRTDCLGDRFFAYAALSNQNVVCIGGNYTVDEDTLYQTFRHADGPYASMLRSFRTSDAPAESNAMTLNLVHQADAPTFMGAGLGDRVVLRGRSEDDGPKLSLYLRARPAIGYGDRVGCLYSDLYMPYAVSVAQLGDNYVPVIGSMLFNTLSNRPMWYTGEKWVYADGTDADFS